ncbi:hypothetical protein GGR50DRAFT_693189 [Xylaria sp. CBS 124048]|nr:hypothetical protein GGR50DRAFT_693189 [Xylaria sp. CBS 124048]
MPGRRKIDLEPYKEWIIDDYQNGMTVQSILDTLQYDYLVSIDRKAFYSRLKEWVALKYLVMVLKQLVAGLKYIGVSQSTSYKNVYNTCERFLHKKRTVKALCKMDSQCNHPEELAQVLNADIDTPWPSLLDLVRLLLIRHPAQETGRSDPVIKASDIPPFEKITEYFAWRSALMQTLLTVNLAGHDMLLQLRRVIS